MDVPVINQTTAANEPDLLASTSDDYLAKSLWRLSDRLRYMGRREDTLMVMQEPVELYRQLAADCPEACNPDLAVSLDNLSAFPSDREDALRAIQEAVEIHRRLAADRPATFTQILSSPSGTSPSVSLTWAVRKMPTNRQSSFMSSLRQNIPLYSTQIYNVYSRFANGSHQSMSLRARNLIVLLIPSVSIPIILIIPSSPSVFPVQIVSLTYSQPV